MLTCSPSDDSVVLEFKQAHKYLIKAGSKTIEVNIKQDESKAQTD